MRQRFCKPPRVRLPTGFEPPAILGGKAEAPSRAEPPGRADHPQRRILAILLPSASQAVLSDQRRLASACGLSGQRVVMPAPTALPV